MTTQITGTGISSFDERIVRLALLSPRAALAELMGAIKAPFTPNVTAVFPTTDANKVVSGSMDVTILGADTFVRDVIFDIQVPSAFQGQVFKSLYDFFYNKTSGIAAKIRIDGSPRYSVAPEFTPLSNLIDFMPANWPDGWRLGRNNGVHMDFTSLAPLPFSPITVTATFRAYQYVSDVIDGLSLDRVYELLKCKGFDVRELADKCGIIP